VSPLDSERKIGVSSNDSSRSLCSLGKQGHIEDVAIAKDYQGRKLGTLMIEILDKISAQVGSYKVCALQATVNECTY
jgi:ribosomal protein S18 acetylase RimI-like enzyme